MIARRIVQLTVAVIFLASSMVVLRADRSASSAQPARPEPKPSFAEPGISPDGHEIAFVSGGDIWTVPVGGGEARLLVSHAAREDAALRTAAAARRQAALADVERRRPQPLLHVGPRWSGESLGAPGGWRRPGAAHAVP